VRRLVLAAVIAVALASPASAQDGRALFDEACSTCHGDDANGIRGTAPTLHGVGRQAADFYLSTGRMPLADPEDEPPEVPPLEPVEVLPAPTAVPGPEVLKNWWIAAGW